METRSVLLLCILVTCTVWVVQGRNVQVSIDSEEQVDVSVEADWLPGICRACEWALKKVKKILGHHPTKEKVKEKLLAICDDKKIRFLKSECSKFVKNHLWELVEELSTTDDVRTICVNTRACKPKKWMKLLFYPNDKGSSNEINEFVRKK